MCAQPPTACADPCYFCPFVHAPLGEPLQQCLNNLQKLCDIDFTLSASQSSATKSFAEIVEENARTGNVSWSMPYFLEHKGTALPLSSPRYVLQMEAICSMHFLELGQGNLKPRNHFTKCQSECLASG